MVNKIKAFLSESRQEFQHVNWPTFQETLRLTGFVVAMSLGVAFFLGAFDFLFTTVLSRVIS